MMADAGRIAKECSLWGMPLLMMVYARGHDINSYDPHNIAHCARVGAELGADIVKVPYTGDAESFADVVEDCGVPVLIAGGPKLDSTRKLLEMVHGSLQAGGAGLSVGRNVFEHPNRILLVKALRAMVHANASIEEALAMMGEN
jgi:class I fructose-bisphosphate aldolase